MTGAGGFATTVRYAKEWVRDEFRVPLAAWEPCHRPWANPPCPCLHSDPKFPDCQPGATVRVRGGVWFVEGPDLDAALRRIEQSGWREGK